MFFVTLLNHIYWFSGATLGGIFGSFIHFNTEGLDFVMTAMFVAVSYTHLGLIFGRLQPERIRGFAGERADSRTGCGKRSP